MKILFHSRDGNHKKVIIIHSWRDCCLASSDTRFACEPNDAEADWLNEDERIISPAGNRDQTRRNTWAVVQEYERYQFTGKGLCAPCLLSDRHSPYHCTDWPAGQEGYTLDRMFSFELSLWYLYWLWLWLMMWRWVCVLCSWKNRNRAFCWRY